MRPPSGTLGSAHAYERTCLETSVLRDSQNELQDRLDKLAWSKIPNVKKLPAREREDGNTILVKVNYNAYPRA